MNPFLGLTQEDVEAEVAAPAVQPVVQPIVAEKPILAGNTALPIATRGLDAPIVAQKKTLGARAQDFVKSMGMGVASGWNKAAQGADMLNTGAAFNMANMVGRKDVASRIADEGLVESESYDKRGADIKAATPNPLVADTTEFFTDPVALATLAAGGPITQGAIGGLVKGGSKFGAGLLEKTGGKVVSLSEPLARKLQDSANAALFAMAGTHGVPVIGNAIKVGAGILNAPRVVHGFGAGTDGLGKLATTLADKPMGPIRGGITAALAGGLNIGGARATLNTARDIGEARVPGLVQQQQNVVMEAGDIPSKQPRGQIYGATLD